MHMFNVIFVSILGTLLHFTYEWSGNNPIVGVFSAVNESTWEHLKLLFFPMLITTIIWMIRCKGIESGLLCAKLKGIVVSMLFTVAFFYTSMGVLGTNYAFLNILTFYAAVIIGEYIVWKSLKENRNCNTRKAAIILGILLVSFIIFTFYTPEIGLFRDPITGTFGI